MLSQKKIIANKIEPWSFHSFYYLKISDNNRTLHIKEWRKEQTKPKVSERKEIVEVRGDMNKMKKKKAILNINKSKHVFWKKK